MTTQSTSPFAHDNTDKLFEYDNIDPFGTSDSDSDSEASETECPVDDEMIPLTLEKCDCYLEGKKFGEYIPIERVQALIESDMLHTTWKKDSYAHNCSQKWYKNEKNQLEDYLKIYNPNSKVFEVSYNKSKSKWGRCYVNKSLGMTSFCKKIRNALICDIYYDFDIKNEAPSILEIICKKHNIACAHISNYVNNRDKVLDKIATHYEVDRSVAKELMIRLCFGGSIQKWKETCNVRKQQDLQSLIDFKEQLNEIAEKIRKANPILYKSCKDKKDEKDEKAKKPNYLGSLLSTYLFEYESRIVPKVQEYIAIHTPLSTLQGCDLPVQTNEYDGIKLLKENVNKYGGVDKVRLLLNEKTLELTGFSLLWECKPITEFHTLSEEMLESARKSTSSESTSTGVFNDLEAAQKLYRLYPHWKYCNQELYVFDNRTGMWSIDRAVQDQIIIKHSDYLYQACYDSKGLVVVSKTKSYGNTESLRRQIYPSLKTLCIDDDWLNRTQLSSCGKLLFQNGYYDSSDNKFHDKFNPNIVFFAQIPHKWETFSDEDMEYMEGIAQRLFINPLGKAQGEFLMLNLARGLMGDMMKRFIMGLGAGDSGKSTVSRALTYACGSYVGTFNAENLAHKNTSDDEAKNMRWMMLLRHKRLIFSNEMKVSPNTNLALNGNMIKKMASGGDSLIGRTHGQEEMSFIPQFLAVIFANDTLPISPYDDAVDNRLRIISYKKKFVDNPTNEFELKKDENIDKEIQTLQFRKALIGLLIHTYVDYMETGLHPEPEDVKNAKREWVSDEERDPLSIVLKDYTITNDGNHYTFSYELENTMKQNKINISMKKFTSLLKQHCIINSFTNVISKDKKEHGKTKQAWIGIKRNEDTSIDNVVDNDPHQPSKKQCI